MCRHSTSSIPPEKSISTRTNTPEWLRSHGRCWYCGVDLDPRTFHLDHIVPRFLGGGNDEDNLVASCPGCNTSKNKRTLEEFRWIRTRQRDGIPYFSPAQLEWLSDHGFDFPDSESYIFWFESERMA